MINTLICSSANFFKDLPSSNYWLEYPIKFLSSHYRPISVIACIVGSLYGLYRYFKPNEMDKDLETCLFSLQVHTHRLRRQREQAEIAELPSASTKKDNAELPSASTKKDNAEGSCIDPAVDREATGGIDLLSLKLHIAKTKSPIRKADLEELPGTSRENYHAQGADCYFTTVSPLLYKQPKYNKVKMPVKKSNTRLKKSITVVQER